MAWQSVTPSYVVDESGHQLDVENSFVQITAALPCEGGIITVAFGDTIKLMAPLCLLYTSDAADE